MKWFPIVLLTGVGGEILQAVQGLLHMQQVNTIQGAMLAGSALMHIGMLYAGWMLICRLTVDACNNEQQHAQGD